MVDDRARPLSPVDPEEGAGRRRSIDGSDVWRQLNRQISWATEWWLAVIQVDDPVTAIELVDASVEQAERRNWAVFDWRSQTPNELVSAAERYVVDTSNHAAMTVLGITRPASTAAQLVGPGDSEQSPAIAD